MKLLPLSKENIKSVMSDLSEVSRKEAEIFGVSIEQLQDIFLGMIDKPFTGAFYGENDDICYALCGLESIGLNQWRTHFAARKDGFDQIWFPLTRFLKKVTDDLVWDRSGYIEIISAYRNGKAHDWFELMGFRLLKTEGVQNKYVKLGR